MNAAAPMAVTCSGGRGEPGSRASQPTTRIRRSVVHASGGPSGTVVLTNVQQVQFGDKTVTLRDTSADTTLARSLLDLFEQPASFANGAMLVNCGLEMPRGGCNEKTGEVFLRSREDFGTQRVQTGQ